MIEWIKSFFPEKEDWRLVHVIENGVNRSNRLLREKEEGILFYRLFESNKGNRKVEFGITFSDLNEDKDELAKHAKSMDTYQRTVVRWLAGRNDPKIQRYSQVPEEEMMDKLRG